MWDKWFRQWLDAIFWWLPKKEQDQEGPVQKEQPGRPERKNEPAAAAAAKPERAASPSTPPDDLTAIKGLGPAMQGKLAEIGITTFKDLAEADAQTLTDQLKPAQRTVTKEKVQGWSKEARKHLAG